MTEKRFVKKIVGNWNYAEKYYNKVYKDMRENPNTNIDKVIFYRPFRWEECKKANAEFTIVVIYKNN